MRSVSLTWSSQPKNWSIFHKLTEQRVALFFNEKRAITAMMALQYYDETYWISFISGHVYVLASELFYCWTFWQAVNCEIHKKMTKKVLPPKRVVASWQFQSGHRKHKHFRFGSFFPLKYSRQMNEFVKEWTARRCTANMASRIYQGEYEYFSTCAYLQYSLSFNAQFSLFILFFFRCSECEETRNGICASKFSVLTQWRLLGLTTTKCRRLYNISEVLESTLHYFDRIVTNETPKYAWNSAKYTTGLSSTSEML